MRLVRTTLVGPRKHLVEVSALVRSTHSIDADHRERLERRIGVAHERLTDVVQAVVAVQADLLLWHVFDGLWVVREAQEVLEVGLGRVQRGAAGAAYQTVELVEHGDSIDQSILIIGGLYRLGQAGRKLFRNSHDPVAS